MEIWNGETIENWWNVVIYFSSGCWNRSRKSCRPGGSWCRFRCPLLV